jgi:Uma2 family endonuclease
MQPVWGGGGEAHGVVEAAKLSIACPGAYNGYMATISTEPVSASPARCVLPPPTPEGRLRFNRAAYHRLVEIGILSEDSRVELIDGEILMMSPIGPPRGSLICRLTSFFVRQLGDVFDCRIQLPIVVGDHSEPEPDLAIVHRRDDDYQLDHPAPTDIELLIEVAQSSKSYDLGLKLRLYALSGIREYWVIDVATKTVLVHCDPTRDQFRSVIQYGLGDKIAPLATPNSQLDLARLFR